MSESPRPENQANVPVTPQPLDRMQSCNRRLATASGEKTVEKTATDFLYSIHNACYLEAVETLHNAILLFGHIPLPAAASRRRRHGPNANALKLLP